MSHEGSGRLDQNVALMGTAAVQSERMETTPQFTNAACKTAPPGMFYPDREKLRYARFLKVSAEARAICNGCEYRRDCLTYALTIEERDGIWGATTETDRTHIFWAHTTNREDAKWFQTSDEMIALIQSSGIDEATTDRLVRFVYQQRNKIRHLATAIQHALPEAAPCAPQPEPAVTDQPIAAGMVAMLRALAERDAATWELRTMTGNKKVSVHVAKARTAGWIEPTGELSKNETRQFAPVYRLTDAGYERIPDE